MAEMTSWVHQYTLRDLLDESFDLFRERASTLLLAGLITWVPMVLYILVMRLFVFKGMFDATASESIWRQYFTTWEGLTYIGGSTLLGWVGSTLGYLAQCRITVWHALGRPFTLGQAFRGLFNAFWSLTVLSVVYLLLATAVAAIIGAIAFFVVAVLIGVLFISHHSGSAETAGITAAAIVALAMIESYFFIGTYFLAAPTIIAVDNLGPFAALGRSWSMGAKQFKAYFGSLYVVSRMPFLLVLPLVVYAVTRINDVATYVAPNSQVVLSTLINGISMIIFLAMLAGLQALVYLDGRCRRDALDLHLLARDIGLGDEIDEALRTQPAKPAAVATYPNYAAAPNYLARPTAAAPPPATAAPGVPGLMQPQVYTGYPDYSAPPPAFDTPPAEPATVTTPDYSAPPVQPASAAPDYSAPPPQMAAPAPDYAAPPQPASTVPDYSAPPPREDDHVQ